MSYKSSPGRGDGGGGVIVPPLLTLKEWVWEEKEKCSPCVLRGRARRSENVAVDNSVREGVNVY